MAKKTKTMPPIHPGETLREDFLKQLGLSANRLAIELQVPVTRVNDIVRGRRAITADTALRLARYFGTTPQFWINLQTNYDLDVARDARGSEIADRFGIVKVNMAAGCALVLYEVQTPNKPCALSPDFRLLPVRPRVLKSEAVDRHRRGLVVSDLMGGSLPVRLIANRIRMVRRGRRGRRPRSRGTAPLSKSNAVGVEKSQQFVEVGVHRLGRGGANGRQSPSTTPLRRSLLSPGAANRQCRRSGPSP